MIASSDFVVDLVDVRVRSRRVGRTTPIEGPGAPALTHASPAHIVVASSKGEAWMVPQLQAGAAWFT